MGRRSGPPAGIAGREADTALGRARTAEADEERVDSLAGTQAAGTAPDQVTRNTDPLAGTQAAGSAPDRKSGDTDPLARTDVDEVGAERPAGLHRTPAELKAAVGRAASASRDGSPALAATVPRIGRFAVLDVLGSGGMGVVFAAYDPQLDRRVAIKMLHEAISGSHASRLEREARGMAQLSHPNVVAVHETGTFEGRLYIAMEYVEGETLSQWLRSAPRTRAEILDRLIQAGRGLAAAHEVGLVHRDFKPDNVLVGKDGRVRVSDFGLVTEVGERSGVTRDEPLAVPSPSNLTMTGAVMGTPLYMAPEQHAGRPADAKADQFSFTVSLWQALCDESPYGADTYEDLVANVHAGRLRPIPRGIRLPSGLRSTLTRGLSASPDDRFPSMNALLAALERYRRRPRWALLATSALVVVAGVAAVALRGGAERDRCGAGKTRIEGVWSAARRASIATTFATVAAPAVDVLGPRVDQRIGGYTSAWADRHRTICEATRDGEQSAELLDLRMHCLDRRLADLDAILDRLGEQPDRATLLKAVDATANLGDLGECDEVERLRERIRLPADPAIRSQIATHETTLAEAKSFDRLGRFARALEIVAPVAAAAATLDYPPLEAEAVLLRAGLEARAGEQAKAEASYRAAADAAARARDDVRLAQSWADLMSILAAQGRPDEALALAPVAKAAAERVSDRRELSARFANNLAGIYQAQGKFPEARVEYERALELQRAIGDDNPQLPYALLNLGTTLWYSGDIKGARALIEDARTRFVASFGRQHPTVAYVERNLGDLALVEGEIDKAIEHQRAAVDIWQAVHGPEHIDVAIGLEALGSALAQKGEHAAAREAANRALAIRVPTLGPDHALVVQLHALLDTIDIAEASPESLSRVRERLSQTIALAATEDVAVARTLDQLASIDAMQGDAAAVLGHRERSLDIREKVLGVNWETAYAHYKLAQAQLAVDQLDAAEASYRRAAAMRRKTLGENHPDVADGESEIGDVRVRQGRFADALAIYQRTIETATRSGASPTMLAKMTFGKARALWAAGKKDDARALATQLRDGTDHAEVRSAIDGWLSGLAAERAAP